MSDPLEGYTVEKTNHLLNFAYRLTGKRGARIGMCRYVNAPDYFFPVSLPKSRMVAVNGHTLWTDKDGQLRPVADTEATR